MCEQYVTCNKFALVQRISLNVHMINKLFKSKSVKFHCAILITIIIITSIKEICTVFQWQYIDSDINSDISLQIVMS